MFTIELKYKVADREVSLDRFVEALVSEVSDTVRRDLQHDDFSAPASQPPPRPQPKAVAVDKAAELIGVSTRTLWNHIQIGTLKVTRVGRRVLISSQTLDKVIQEGLPRLRE